MISVIGLLPAQANIIAQQFKGRVNIAFWDADSFDKLKSLCNRSDVVFMRTKHANHKVYTYLKAHKANIVHVGGGMESLKLAIERYLENG